MTGDPSWDCPGLRWAAGRGELRQDWWAWLSIPWRGISPAHDPPRIWRANLYRIERPRDGEPEFSGWSPTLTRPADFHKPACFGLLELAGDSRRKCYPAGRMIAGHPSRLTPAAASRIVWALFAVGLLIALGMLARSQVGGDQLDLLARGWLLAVKGRWIAYGNPMSTGGKAPGAITSLLVALPLFLWRDHRAASAFVLVFHVARLPAPGRHAQAHPLSVRAGAARGPLLAEPVAALLRLVPLEPELSLPVRRDPPVERPGASASGPGSGPRSCTSPGSVLAFQIHASCLLLAVASLPARVAPLFPGALAGGRPRRADRGDPPRPLGDRGHGPSRDRHRGQQGVPRPRPAPGLPASPRPALLDALRLAGGLASGWTPSTSRTSSAPTAGWAPACGCVSTHRALRHDRHPPARQPSPLAPGRAAAAASGSPRPHGPVVAQGICAGLLRRGGDRLRGSRRRRSCRGRA